MDFKITEEMIRAYVATTQTADKVFAAKRILQRAEAEKQIADVDFGELLRKCQEEYKLLDRDGSQEEIICACISAARLEGLL